MLTKQNKIEWISAHNYKNLGLTNGLPLNDLNIFIGSNGSGKSNFVNILRLLQNSLIPNNNGDISGLRRALTDIGGSHILKASLQPPNTVTLIYVFNLTTTTSSGISDHITYELSILAKKEDNLPIINKELLSSLRATSPGDTPFYYYKLHDKTNGEGIISVFSDDNTKSKFHKLEEVPANDLGLNSILTLLENTEYPPDKTPIYSLRRTLLDTISNWRFYNANNMNLNEIRKAEPEIGPEDIFLNSSCDNLAIVLDNLIQANFSFIEKLNTAMTDIFPEMVGIRTKRLGRLRLTIEWQFKNSKRPFYLDEMSDGSVRMLCWALILLSPQLPSLIVLDEPEIGLHPSWLKVLAEWIKSASQRTQVIVCTHSPDLLDQFTDHLEDIFVFNSQDKTTFTAEKLKIEQLQTWLDEGWELGDLYRVGDPAVGGWPI